MRPTAIIDIGTNTIILLIADVSAKKEIRVLHDEARVVRLGEGINQNTGFLPVAMDRAFAVLSDFSQIIQKNNCDAVHVVGTAGFRRAGNANEFIARVKKHLHLDVVVISGEREADLVFLSVHQDPLFKNSPQPFAVLDIGGGSTELIMDDVSSHHVVSLPFGSVVLTERFLPSDPPTAAELKQLDDFIRSQLITNSEFTKVSGLINLVATAGTATTIAALVQNLKNYDAKKVHGSVVRVAALKSLAERLQSMNTATRQALPCLEPKRADVIVAGAHILINVCDFFKITQFSVSDRGLRYGVLFDTLGCTSGLI